MPRDATPTHVTAWHGMARYGTAWHGMARRAMPCYSTPCHSTNPIEATRPSTAPNSTQFHPIPHHTTSHQQFTTPPSPPPLAPPHLHYTATCRTKPSQAKPTFSSNFLFLPPLTHSRPSHPTTPGGSTVEQLLELVNAGANVNSFDDNRWCAIHQVWCIVGSGTTPIVGSGTSLHFWYSVVSTGVDEGMQHCM